MILLLEASLKAKYWELIVQEDYPNTPRITKKLDEIQQAIKESSSLTQNEGIEA